MATGLAPEPRATARAAARAAARAVARAVNLCPSQACCADLQGGGSPQLYYYDGSGHARSHHKGAAGRVRTGDKRHPALCRCQLRQDIPAYLYSYSYYHCDMMSLSLRPHPVSHRSGPIHPKMKSQLLRTHTHTDTDTDTDTHKCAPSGVAPPKTKRRPSPAAAKPNKSRAGGTGPAAAASGTAQTSVERLSTCSAPSAAASAGTHDPCVRLYI